MIEYHDYNPKNPFDVFNEIQTIENGRITLNYVPLQNSVIIDGFRAIESKTDLVSGAFFIDYSAEDKYLSADGVIYFSPDDNGQTVTINYKGVSTLLKAKDMNEIKRFIEAGASELAARILVTHETIMYEKMQAWQESVLNELAGIKTELAETKEILAKFKCCCGDNITPDMIADDDEADALLDEYFEGDVTPTEKTSEIATDEEADTMLDEFFYTQPGSEENPSGIEEVADDEEFETALADIFPKESDL